MTRFARTWADAALVLVGHGSSESDEAARIVEGQALQLQQRTPFRHVQCAFLKADPTISVVIDRLQTNHVYIVPMMMDEGPLAVDVLPKLVRASASDGQTAGGDVARQIDVCRPIGVHAGISEIIAERAKGACRAACLSPTGTEVMVVGHGHATDGRAGRALHAHVARLDSRELFRCVSVAFLETDPTFADVLARAVGPTVVVAALLGGGAHVGQDVAAKIRGARQRRSSVCFAGAIGDDPRIAEIVIDQVRAYDRHVAA